MNFNFNSGLLSNFSTQQQYSSNLTKQDDIFQNPEVGDLKTYSVDLNESTISSDSSQVPDFSDASLKFINDILLEEDLDESPGSVEEYRALQETEKSLYDALGEEYSHSSDCIPSYLEESIQSPDDGFDGRCVNDHEIEGYVNGETNFEANWVLDRTLVEPLMTRDDISRSRSFLDLNSQYSRSSNSCDDSGDGAATSPVGTLSSAATERLGKLINHSGTKKNHHRDEDDVKGRSNKHQASYNEDYVEMDQYDDVLLSKEYHCDISTCTDERLSNEESEELCKKGSKGRTHRGKKQYSETEEVDLRTLLSQCAQAVSSFDLRSANEILRQIRQHSSPYGDSLQRVAHHFANGVEARLAGTGSTVSIGVGVRISLSVFLKAYKLYMSTVPFKRTSYFLANKFIFKLAEKATRIHIIDFGISLGLQWPCFIQNLSKRPLGPPKLRITGIDYPQQGFRPAERVEATGRRLSGYCDRFDVPFQYRAIAQKWETIKPENLKIESDELVIVNCMIRSGILLDETVDANSPKDAFLRLIKKINPHLFIHGTINGTYNAPFFITRFREALFHYSSVFDVFEVTMHREDCDRLLIESEIYGKEISNVIACEAAERIHRPETYKQWQLRTTRAGLRQLPLDQGLLSRAKAMVKANYHKDFVVDEDRHWMLQGWKGRILYGLSFWQTN